MLEYCFACFYLYGLKLTCSFLFSVAANEIDGEMLLGLTDKILIDNFSTQINFAQRRALLKIIGSIEGSQNSDNSRDTSLSSQSTSLSSQSNASEEVSSVCETPLSACLSDSEAALSNTALPEFSSELVCLFLFLVFFSCFILI